MIETAGGCSVEPLDMWCERRAIQRQDEFGEHRGLDGANDPGQPGHEVGQGVGGSFYPSFENAKLPVGL